jgi:hypothetical protein
MSPKAVFLQLCAPQTLRSQSLLHINPKRVFWAANAAQALVRYKATELTLQDDPFDVGLILGQHSQTIC